MSRLAMVVESLSSRVCLLVLCALVALAANAQPTVSLIGAGSNPTNVAVNPVTNQVFVVNYASNNMTVFDPITGKTTTVAVGSRPTAVVVNPVTNMAYVANEYNVIAVDGKNPSATQTITTGGATCLAVNPTTNMIFACVNKGVSAINGATNSFAIYSTGKTNGYRARLVAVNTRLNRVYVANSDWTFDILDMDTGTVTQQDVSWIATGIAVNPQTDRVYISANNMSVGHLVVMDATGSILNDYPAGTIATAVAVNPATNKVYVTNHYTNDTTYKDDVLVLDGDSGALTTLANGGNGGRAVAVNPVTNQVYVLHDLDKTVSVIDGNTNASSAVNIGRNLWEVAVNPTTGQVFATNPDDSSFAVIGDSMPAKVTVKETNLISPWTIAANPVTNKVYVANSGSNSTPGPVTIIDGDTNAVKSVTAAIGEWLAVDPAINKIYIGHGSTTTLAIFDGATEQYSTVYYTDLAKMAVNPNDNTLYLVNYSPTASVLDPVTKQLTNISIGGRGQFLAVNPATNKIYITNDANIIVIDGATKQVAKTITDAARPGAISINPKTNRIYITNTYDSTVSVIDGSTDTVISHVTMGLYPAESVVNPETNRAYFVESSGIKVLDGATNTIYGSVPMQCSSGCSIYINPAINKIYVTQYPSGIAIIDGATNQPTFVATGDGAHMMGINPVNNKLYVANRFDDSITIIGASNTAQNPLTTTVQPLPGNVTSNPGPVMKFTATSGFTPHAADVQNVYYQVDSWLGPWVKTQYADGEFAAQLDTLWPGTHTVYAFATDGADATAMAKSANLVGGIATYSFTVTSSAPPPAVPVLDVTPTTMTFDAVQGGTNPVAESITIANAGGGTLNWTAAKTQTWLSLDAASGTGDAALGVSVDVAGLTAGTYTDTITIAATGATGSPKTVAVTFTVQPPPAVLAVSATSLTFTAATGGANPAAQTMTITNTGGGTLNWTASKTQSWLSFENASGTAPGTVQVSVNASGLAVGTYQDTITVTATGATGSPKTVAVTLNVQAPPDFQMNMGSGSSTTATIAAGGVATFNIMVAPMNSFSGMVTMSCSGLPAKSTCSFNPTQQQVTGTTAMPFTMTVTTTPVTIVSGSTVNVGGWPRLMLGAILVTGMVMVALFVKRPRLIVAMVTLAAVVGLGACGNGNKTKTLAGTPAGSYPITVTATSGGTSHTMTVTLTVN